MSLRIRNIARSFCIFLLSTFPVYADDSDVGRELKTLPHWLISCDNLGECMAVGYPVKGDDNIEQPWYIATKWKKDSDIFTFYIRDYESINTNCSVKLCEDNTQCRTIDAKDKLHIVIQKNAEGSWRGLKLDFILNADALSSDSYVTFSEVKNTPIYLKELLENRNSIKVDYLSQSAGKERIYNWQGHKYNIAAKDLKKFYPQYTADDEDTYCAYPSSNFIVKYRNGDKLLFICGNEGYDYTIAKYNGKKYEDFDSVEAIATHAPISNTVPSFGNIEFDAADHSIFHTDNIQHGSIYICGIAYDMAYNGKKFIVETIRYMPLCMTIPIEDWPIVYQRPQ